MIVSTENHIRLFDRIAKPYGWFFGAITRRYTGLVEQYRSRLAIESGGKVLDVGCGPGAMAAAFGKFGYDAVGVDGSPRMKSVAEARGISCTVADATKKLPFEDDSFDLVTAAYVAHGLFSEQRISLFHELKRLAKATVLLHDFSPSDSAFSPFSLIGILERLEKSDYVRFRSDGVKELETVFAGVEILPIDKRSSWYICSA